MEPFVFRVVILVRFSIQAAQKNRIPKQKNKMYDFTVE